MKFKAGVLGVVVIIMALVGTLMGSWIMSMDVEEVQVTRYNALADIVGEFDSEQTPTFTEYNPSTNYTGYYTDESIIDSTKYFDGVDYSPSKPNNYRVNLPPTDHETDNKTLSGGESASPGAVVYVRVATGDDTVRTVEAMFVSLSDLMETWDYSDSSRITVKNTDDSIDWSDFTDIEDSWVAFIPKSWMEMHAWGLFLIIKNPDLTVQEVQAMDPAISQYAVRNPTMSCEYLVSTDSVQIFYDNDMSDSAGVYKPSDVLVLFGTSRVTDTSIGLGTTVDVSAFKLPDATYLDPSAGVVMS